MVFDLIQDFLAVPSKVTVEYSNHLLLIHGNMVKVGLDLVLDYKSDWLQGLYHFAEEIKEQELFKGVHVWQEQLEHLDSLAFVLEMVDRLQKVHVQLLESDLALLGLAQMVEEKQRERLAPL